MKQPAWGLSIKQLLLATICILSAVSLFAFALMEPKRIQGEEWIPLNDEVERALLAMDNDDGKSAAGKLGNESDVKDAKDLEVVEVVKDVKSEKHEEADERLSGKLEDKIADSGSSEEVATIADGKLDINRATVAELDLLKGIGPAKAQAIVDDRERNGYFSSIDELLRVKGIGNKLLAGIEENIVVRP